MADLSDGFIALPGGFGTFEEFCEVLTWSQLGIHTKPCALMNIGSYFDPLLSLFDQGVFSGFIRSEHRALVLSGSDPDDLMEQMSRWKAPQVSKWIDKPGR